ncbi:hypothetical protein [Solimonas marina]|uniref:Uncharacterized protein n=1 Tax=Solimonas marina TaxID=2714601 RepID=A0A969W9U4_9GAMM|nr:hypothetical protein [Solimonas marina]NKF21571.1 hypothetical protein [Solimonas marina]
MIFAPAPTPQNEEESSGYYFVYLFGSFTDEPPRVFGWRVARDTDKATSIPGLPAEIPGMSVPSGGRVRCSADNHAHGSEIAVLVNIYADNFSTTSTPISSHVVVYRAEPTTGSLTHVSSLTSAEPLFDWGTGELFYSTGIYASQAAQKYIVRSNDFLIDDYSTSGHSRRANRAYLFDADGNTLTYFDDEESADGAVRELSYAISRVGMSAHHPTLKVFYTSFTRYRTSGGGTTYFRAYSYTNPGDPPALLSEFSLDVVDVFMTPTAVAVSEDGGSLVTLVAAPGGSCTWHPLNADGSFAGGHWFNDLLTNPPLDLTDSAWRTNYFAVTRYASGSPYFEGNIVTMNAPGQPGVMAFNTFTEPMDSNLPLSTGALSFLRLRSDDYAQGMVLSGIETYDRRKANSCVRLLNGKRLLRSVGRRADLSGSSYAYSDVPRLFGHKFTHAATDAWYVPTETVKLDVALATESDIGGMTKTDRLSGIAIFEPLEGMGT